MVFKVIVFEYTFFSFSIFGLSFKFIIGSVLLTISMKKTIFKISSIVLILVFDCQTVTMRQILLKFTEVSVLVLIELPVSNFLVVIIQFSSKKSAFLAGINQARLNLMSILLPKIFDFFKQSGVVYAQIFCKLRQFDEESAPAARVLSHQYLLYYQMSQRILYQIISCTLLASHTCFYNQLHRDYQYIIGKRSQSESRSLQQLTEEYQLEIWGILIRLVVEDFFVIEQ